MMVTNNLHHLIWTEFRLNGYVTVSPGEFFWIFVNYGILIVLSNVAVLVWPAIRSPGHRWPVAIMFAGQMIGRLAYTLNKLEIGLPVFICRQSETIIGKIG